MRSSGRLGSISVKGHCERSILVPESLVTRPHGVFARNSGAAHDISSRGGCEASIAVAVATVRDEAKVADIVALRKANAFPLKRPREVEEPLRVP